MPNNTFDFVWGHYKAARVVGKKRGHEVVRIYERYIRPAFGSMDAEKIKLPDIQKLHGSLRETPYQANRVLALLRPLFDYAVALEVRKTAVNPARHVKFYTERKRRRHMKPHEAPLIAAALVDAEKTATDAAVFLWLLIFTGARPGEIKSARWQDLFGNQLTLSKHKTDHKGTDRIIMVPDAALDKMRLLYKGEPGDKIIGVKHPEYLWRQIRKIAKCSDMRVYDLRHTFATYALENGYTLDQIGEALDHTNPATTKIYAELSTRGRSKMAADASTAILRDMGIVEVSEDAMN